jgi:hypothetical protein
LAVASLLACLIGMWVTLALARHAVSAQDGASTAVLSFGTALLLTAGAPLLLALWRYGSDGAAVRHALLWLPLLWNAAGLAVATQLVPDLVGTALRGHGAAVVADRLGDSHSATRALAALEQEAADRLRPAAPPKEPDPTTIAAGDLDRERAIQVPFAEGSSIVVDVRLIGPTGPLELPYLFDTGASFTTIDSAAASALGLVVPDDAPTLRFGTAAGPRESRMIHLPALEVGGVRVDGLLVSVCDACTTDRARGLLGLNVIREFFVDMTLIPRRTFERPNRAYDIEPVLTRAVEGSPEVWLGRVHWVLTLHNRGTTPLFDVTAAVKFQDGTRLLAKTVPRIEPGATERAVVDGRAGGDQREFTLELVEAYW